MTSEFLWIASGRSSAIFSPYESTTTSSEMFMTSGHVVFHDQDRDAASRMRPISLARSAVSRMLRPAAGSSSRSMRGSAASARASSTARCWP